jgi:NAD-dependent SIR2 family protein deacetylase
MSKTWCIKDEHHLYEQYSDFNEWLDGENGIELQEENSISGLSQPSKAFYASDKEAYRQAYKAYRKDQRHKVLGEAYLTELCSDRHWFQRNLDHFFQFVTCLENERVVPFIGAGLSVEGGFPTWKEHLKDQGRTAGLDALEIEDLLNDGKYEVIIAEIEEQRGKDVFIQEIRDAFSKTGALTNTLLLVSELFKKTIITTNYDALIEQAYDVGEKNRVETIDPFSTLKSFSDDSVSVIKLHGDIKKPTKCILSKSQYDKEYGTDELDMSLPIPKMLSHQYRENSLLFLGCSLNNDRTVQVFKKIKEDLGDTELPQHFSLEQTPETEVELTNRNAYLANIGITPIWFEQEQFEYVEHILQLAVNELRYKKSKTKKDELIPVKEVKETPFVSVNNINWVKENWKNLNNFTKVLIIIPILTILVSGLPYVHSKYEENSKIFEELLKSAPDDKTKIELAHVFYSGMLFNGYFYHLGAKNTEEIVSNSKNELIKCFTILDFKDEGKLLSYKNQSESVELNRKAYYEIRSNFEGYILKKDKNYENLFYIGYYLSDIIINYKESSLNNFKKEWKVYQKTYPYKLPEVPLLKEVKDYNDVIIKAIETNKILKEYFSL